MKRAFLAVLLVFLSTALIGCGNDDNIGQPTITTLILSDPVYDGDIALTTSNSFTITQGMTPTVQSVFAGRDPATGTEYRAFLDFDLAGTDGVPLNAIIVEAFLDIHIDSVLLQTAGDTIPIRIDLVNIQPPAPLLDTDFSRDPTSTAPPLATTTIIPPISQSDYGMWVEVDVTSLMVATQNFVLPDFQVRILEDNSVFGVHPGLIQINDSTTSGAFAPRLKVTYY